MENSLYLEDEQGAIALEMPAKKALLQEPGLQEAICNRRMQIKRKLAELMQVGLTPIQGYLFFKSRGIYFSNVRLLQEDQALEKQQASQAGQDSNGNVMPEDVSKRARLDQPKPEEPVTLPGLEPSSEAAPRVAATSQVSSPNPPLVTLPGEGRK
jgi:hypothetical protein